MKVINSKKYINLDYSAKIPKEYHEIKSKLKHFPCGEFEFSLDEEVFGEVVTIFQSFKVGKFNDDLVKLQIVCDALNRNNVKKIIYFAPFLPYTRQDKIDNKKSSFGLKLLAQIINQSGINEVITYDLHSLHIEGFLTAKLQNLSMMPKFITHIKQSYKPREVVIVFPDEGSNLRFKRFFENEDFEIVIVSKNRTDDGLQMEIPKIFDKLKNKKAIIIDDIIDSGKTLIEASKILKKNGVCDINVYAVHGVFSDNAIEKLKNSDILKTTVSNSIFSDISDKIEVIGLDTL